MTRNTLDLLWLLGFFVAALAPVAWDTQTGGRIDMQLASLFCLAPTGDGSVDSAIGLPGLGRMMAQGRLQGLPGVPIGQLQGGSMQGGSFGVIP